jgi:hypothetical protein
LHFLFLIWNYLQWPSASDEMPVGICGTTVQSGHVILDPKPVVSSLLFTRFYEFDLIWLSFVKVINLFCFYTY